MSYTNKLYSDRHFYYFVHQIYISEASLNSTYLYNAVNVNSTTDYIFQNDLTVESALNQTQQKQKNHDFVLHYVYL